MEILVCKVTYPIPLRTRKVRAKLFRLLCFEYHLRQRYYREQAERAFS